MEIGYVGQPHVKHISQSYGVLHERLFSGKKRKMVRIITKDEREENIYVLNYLLCSGTELFEWSCSNMHTKCIGNCAVYRLAVSNKPKRPTRILGTLWLMQWYSNFPNVSIVTKEQR